MRENSKLVAIVTGATSGIGRETARALHAAGWQVVGVGRDEARLLALAEELPGLLTVTADLASEEAPERVVGAAIEAFGALHGLVNAAGILESGSLEATSDALFDRTMDLNVRALFRLTRAALPHLKAATPKGAIVNVSSVSGLRPFPGVLAYCVSKAAVDQLTRCLGIELAPVGVRVNAVNPGVVVTELHRRGGMSDTAYAAFLERGKLTHPLGRVGQPEDVVRAIVFLLDGAQSGWITGETIAIDGGRHLTAAR